jgi:hypothetical protein
MRGSRSGGLQLPAVEEVAPDRYVIRDPRARPILNGEGELRGPIFELRSWRRDGLVARLRKVELVVLTLDDQLAGLPPLPADIRTGPSGWRALSSAAERFSGFDHTSLTWAPLTPTLHDGLSGIESAAGQPLRRRKSRGASDFFLAAEERGGGLALRPVDETLALLAGYALALRGGAPIVLIARHGDQIQIPAIELPPPYRELLARCATHTRDGWLASGRGWDLAEALLARIGVSCVISEPSDSRDPLGPAAAG